MELKLSKQLCMYCTVQLCCSGVFSMLHIFSFARLSYSSRESIIVSIRMVTSYTYLSVLFGWLWSEKLEGSFHHVYIKTEVKKILKAMLVTLAGSLVFHIFAVLYGAPIIEKIEETYHFSLLMSSLLVFPLFLMTDGKWWTALQVTKFSSYLHGTIIDRVKFISLLAIIGALCGSFTLALDWNRSWKVWPVPCCIGGVTGYVTGLSIIVVVTSVEWLVQKFGQKGAKFY